jgi:hypothetical protein
MDSSHHLPSKEESAPARLSFDSATRPERCVLGLRALLDGVRCFTSRPFHASRFSVHRCWPHQVRSVLSTDCCGLPSRSQEECKGPEVWSWQECLLFASAASGS